MENFSLEYLGIELVYTWSSSLEHHVRDFYNTARVCFTDFDYGLWVFLVVKAFATAHDNRPISTAKMSWIKDGRQKQSESY